MIELGFKELETFKTPDEEEWTIYPLPTEDVNKLDEFSRLNIELAKSRENKDDNQTEGIVKELSDTCDKLIELSIINIDDTDKMDEWIAADRKEQDKPDLIPFPKKFATLTRKIMMCGYIAAATIDMPENMQVDDIPLEVEKKLNEESKQASTSSLKKQDGASKES